MAARNGAPHHRLNRFHAPAAVPAGNQDLHDAVPP
jgi:hypothetical protein